MSDHIHFAQLEAYRRGALDPSEFLAVDDHLAECPNCRARAAQDAISIRQLRSSFETPEAPHCSEAEIEEYAEGRLSSPRALSHLQDCARCREDGEDLRSFVQQGRVITPRPGRNWWPMAAAAAIAVLIAGAFLVRFPREPARHPAATLASRALPEYAVKLRDDAVRAGRIAVPPSIAALQEKTETQLTAGAGPQSTLETPVATATLSSRPEFRWNPVPHADWYQVSIFDQQLRPVQSSGRLRETAWVPDDDLNEGQVYLWELTIFVGGKRFTAPRPPTPQARFMVLPAGERARLADLAARFPEEHVLLGVQYGQAGALADARRELTAAVATGHPEAAPLLATLSVVP
jgi:hypothetical protein